MTSQFLSIELEPPFLIDLEHQTWCLSLLSRESMKGLLTSQGSNLYNVNVLLHCVPFFTLGLWKY